MNDPVDQVGEVYQKRAAEWVRARSTALVEHGWLSLFTTLLEPHASVLDVGCGSGVPIAQWLDDNGFAVTGIDSSSEMIRLFRTNVPAARAEVLDMRRLDLAIRFEGIVAWDSFFHLSPVDQRAMFPLFEHHATTGAPLLLTTGPEAGEVVGNLHGDPLYHASLDPGEYRALFDQHGFDVVAHTSRDPSIGDHTVWLVRKREGVTPSFGRTGPNPHPE
ncbi:class I SAM-dependent methyltransferase [Microbacterium sp. Root553]|uniref:class I SAM-dependent methyltransferase n=1 Tax=Microbacterium sp. Root553 TaxID=1736556 RepID=UPI000701E5C1|nr:class I SAM-dependent methyltransferase [Microbacterium sp. Root553]KQZ23852.1 hypothetical protein ASD43_05405 [Microbacterium sp. Root553]